MVYLVEALGSNRRQEEEEYLVTVILDRRLDVKKSTRRLPDADTDPTEAPNPDDMMMDTNTDDDTYIVDWKSLESTEILNWMTESLHLMSTFWRLADGEW
jgi:hypothetical protein